jgi:hypothetical protein
MAQIANPAIAWYPATEPNGLGVPSFTTTQLLIDGTDESAGFCFQFPATGNVRKIFWGTRAVTTSATMDVRVETVDATGLPSGTLWGTNTNAARSGLTANTGYLDTLTADAAVTRGQFGAVVIKQPTASFGNCQVAAMGTAGATQRYPFCALNAPSGTWTKVAGSPILGLEYDTGAYYEIHGCLPVMDTIGATTTSTGSTPDVSGLRFQVTTPQTFSDVWLWVDADGDFNINLVSTAYHQVNQTGILSSLTVSNKDAQTSPILLRLRMPTYALVPGTWYRLIVEPTSATTIVIYEFNLPSLASMDAWGGANFHYTTAKNPTADGDWTNYNSGTFRKPFIGLGLSAFADDAGGGGGTASIFQSPVVRAA